MSGLHNFQTTPASKSWPDCAFCEGTGLTKKRVQRGFFIYEAGRTCPECSGRHQAEISAAHQVGPKITMDHPMPSNIEAKLDQILAALSRIENGQDNGFCKGHPFQHSIMSDNGMCTICGKPFNPSLRTTL